MFNQLIEIVDLDPLPAIHGAMSSCLAYLPMLQAPVMGTAQIIALILALVALLISGFVSGSEIAYFSITPAQQEELEDTPRGRRVIGLLKLSLIHI